MYFYFKPNLGCLNTIKPVVWKHLRCVRKPRPGKSTRVIMTAEFVGKKKIFFTIKCLLALEARLLKSET